MHFRSIFPFFGPTRGLSCTNSNFHCFYIVGFSKAFICQNTTKLAFYPRFWSKKRKYVPEMHCALMYFYSELMCLICTNINLLYFCIAGFSSAFICQNTTKWPFYPRFWSNIWEILTGIRMKISH